VGIGVGVGVGVPLIIGLAAALIFFLRKRSKRPVAANRASGGSAYGISYTDEAAKHDASSPMSG